MSAKVARLVLNSALPARVKATAHVLATYADDAGDRIFPSLDRLAWDLDKSERQVRSDLTYLVEKGVLIPLSPRTGGAGITTRYRLDVAALPSRPAYAKKPGGRLPCSGDAKDGSGPPRSAPRNTEAGCRESDEKGGSPLPKTRKPAEETRKLTAENPEAHFRRSSQDHEKDLLLTTPEPPAPDPAEPPPSDPAVGVEAGDRIAEKQFLEWFALAYSKHRNGAKFKAKSGDGALVRGLLAMWSEERLQLLATLMLVLAPDVDEWIEKSDRGIGVLNHRATFLDQLLSKAEAARAGRRA